MTRPEDSIDVTAAALHQAIADFAAEALLADDPDTLGRAYEACSEAQEALLGAALNLIDRTASLSEEDLPEAMRGDVF